MRISVLMGGTSSERDVSIASGLRVAGALRQRGHHVVTVDTTRGALSEADERAILAAGGVDTAPPSQDTLVVMARESLPSTVRTLPQPSQVDVAFLALHGGAGEDGTIQALLDLTGVPYTGSGHLASALAMDKDMSKRVLRDAGVPTPDWIMAPASCGRGDADTLEDLEAEALELIGLPMIVKPSKQGSTVGLTVVKHRDQFAEAVREAFRYDDEVMVEQFIAGRELTVAILGGEALPVGEIIPKHEIYDYECKYTAGMAEEIFPADIPAERAREAQDHARHAFAALKLRGCARIDFRMAEDGRLFCLEANTLPGMTQLSLVPQAAAAAGITFPELCERIALLALEERSA